LNPVWDELNSRKHKGVLIRECKSKNGESGHGSGGINGRNMPCWVLDGEGAALFSSQDESRCVAFGSKAATSYKLIINAVQTEGEPLTFITTTKLI
jgi:hypothetical protein